jgi:hypothetical protein
MEFREEGVRVDPCPLGLGVFSMKAFAVHELIGPIEGTVIDDPQYESDYCMEIGDHSALEPESPFRFVNHSCHPNCGLLEVETETPGVLELWLEVLSDISPGEQLTIDYAWPAWAAIPCRCGCPECRGWIVAAGERNRIADDRRRSPSRPD